jgi:hypothetical protein
VLKNSSKNMLRKKIQSMVIKNDLGRQSNFEIIYDQNASMIFGGVASCPNLNTCGSYTGDCPSLVVCGTYSDK